MLVGGAVDQFGIAGLGNWYPEIVADGFIPANMSSVTADVHVCRFTSASIGQWSVSLSPVLVCTVCTCANIEW